MESAHDDRGNITNNYRHITYIKCQVIPVKPVTGLVWIVPDVIPVPVMPNLSVHPAKERSWENAAIPNSECGEGERRDRHAVPVT